MAGGASVVALPKGRPHNKTAKNTFHSRRRCTRERLLQTGCARHSKNTERAVDSYLWRVLQGQPLQGPRCTEKLENTLSPALAVAVS